MIRTHFFAGLLLAGAAATLGAQSGQTPSPASAPPAEKPITLVGCIQLDSSEPEWFTLSDTKTKTTYHLTGPKVKAYVWRNVRIVGGLVPSPNIAAQAGAIDQTKAAMAYQGDKPPSSTAFAPLEFNVARVRQLTGSCAPKSDR